MNRNREFVAVLVIGGTLLAFYWLAIAFLTETSAPAAAIETEAQATQIITVAGTGKLEEESGRWFVASPFRPLVELGAIDERTILRDQFGGRIGRTTVIRERYLGKQVTIIAFVDAVPDNESVFRTVRTRAMTIFRHSDRFVDPLYR